MKYLLIVILSLLMLSCQDYESKEYLAHEDAAIEELIPQFIDLEKMLSMNEYGNSTPTLYIIDRLENKIKIYPDTIETIIKEDSTGIYVQREISENTVEEKRVFKPLTRGSLNERLLTSKIQNEQLVIEMLSEDNFMIEHRNLADRVDNNPNIFGYLFISRVIFNRDFTVGYLGYSFFCGGGCAWNNNIEIRKQDSKWKITKYFSGGIA